MINGRAASGFGLPKTQTCYRTARHRALHVAWQDETIRHQVQGIRHDYRRSETGCPTSEEQPGGKAFGSNPKGFELLKTYLAAATFRQ